MSVGDRARKVWAADRQRIERRDEVLLGIGFEYEPSHPRPEDVHDDLFAIVHCVEQDLDARKLALQRMGKIEAVQLRDRVVQNCDIGPDLPRELEPLSSIGSLADHLVIGFGFEQLTNSPPDRVVIINNQDPAYWASHTSRSLGPWLRIRGTDVSTVPQD